jgi:hypothetical protein
LRALPTIKACSDFILFYFILFIYFPWNWAGTMRKKKGEECGVFEKWNAHPLFSQILRSLFFEKKEKKKLLVTCPPITLKN